MSIAEPPDVGRGERSAGEIASDVTARGANPPRLHLAYLDGLRALASLYVVAVHALTRRADRTKANAEKTTSEALRHEHRTA